VLTQIITSTSYCVAFAPHTHTARTRGGDGRAHRNASIDCWPGKRRRRARAAPRRRLTFASLPEPAPVVVLALVLFPLVLERTAALLSMVEVVDDDREAPLAAELADGAANCV
jgi:hypothetical protein